MKKSFKILSFLLALLIFVAAFSGCNPLSDENGTLGGTTAESQQTTATESAIGTTEGENSPSESEIESDTVESGDLSETVEVGDTTADESAPEVSTTEGTTTEETEEERAGTLRILNGSEITLEVGDSVRLTVYKSSGVTQTVGWGADNRNIYVDDNGLVTALEVGDVTVTAFAGALSDTILIHVIEKTVETTEETTTEETTEAETQTTVELPEADKLETVPRDEIHEAVNSPEGYKPAGSREEALERAENGQLAGYDFVPDQAPILSEYRPMKDGKYVKNTDSYYIDNDTYVVIDAYGREVFRLYRGGAYITLEEVAAYVYAFGTIPANHSTSKNTKPTASIWGEYLRVNNTRFSGDTSKYPYEPALPRISGCGGDLQYWEMDIGTTGTDCDPGYQITTYNNGSKITRGAARIVYTWNDLNGNGIIDATDVVFVFYTYNHYNDFQEYLNYYGGWGDIFGNVTGGGKLSSKTDYNPTPYVPAVAASITALAGDGDVAENYVIYAWVDRRAFEYAACA